MYTPITKTKLKILKGYHLGDVNEARVSDDPHLGIDIEGSQCFSLFSGTILDIGQDSAGCYIVSVRFNDNKLVRYGHLISVTANTGDYISQGSCIGSASNNYIHIEYCTQSNEAPLAYPVYIYSSTYYKQDPEPILSGDLLNDSTKFTEVEYRVSPELQEVLNGL